MYISRRKCEVVLAVANLTTRFIGCGFVLWASVDVMEACTVEVGGVVSLAMQ